MIGCSGGGRGYLWSIAIIARTKLEVPQGGHKVWVTDIFMSGRGSSKHMDRTKKGVGWRKGWGLVGSLPYSFAEQLRERNNADTSRRGGGCKWL